MRRMPRQRAKRTSSANSSRAMPWRCQRSVTVMPSSTRIGTVGFAVARDADELLPAFLLDRRDERHAPVVVDVHQPVEQVRRQEFQRRHQPVVARALGERIDEFDFALAVIRPQRANAQPHAVARAGLRSPARQQLGRHGIHHDNLDCRNSGARGSHLTAVAGWGDAGERLKRSSTAATPVAPPVAACRRAGTPCRPRAPGGWCAVRRSPR